MLGTWQRLHCSLSQSWTCYIASMLRDTETLRNKRPLLPGALRNESSGTMTTIIGTAISTSNDVPSLDPSDVNGSVPTNHNTQLNGQPTRNWEKRYRHIAAVHSRPRTSCLSHDSDAAPSFLGFRDLMVIVLSTWNPAACVTSVHDGKLPDTICQL